MAMKTLRIQIRPATSFGTPLRGVTLFGQLCWAAAEKSGSGRLSELLGNYSESPFAVLSDAFPHGFVPIPSVPHSLWASVTAENRKTIKAKRWLPADQVTLPLNKWQAAAADDKEAGLLRESSVTSHNSINRVTGTTGEGAFAPFQSIVTAVANGVTLDLYAVIDEDRFTESDLLESLTAIGTAGFGRDASTGLGKFEVIGSEEMPASAQTESWLTLADSSLRGMGADEARSFYKPRAHFGRFGNYRALTGTPFKKPVLLAETGAVITFAEPRAFPFIGRAVTGVSPVWTDAVMQGYAPVLPLAPIALEDL